MFQNTALSRRRTSALMIISKNYTDHGGYLLDYALLVQDLSTNIMFVALPPPFCHLHCSDSRGEKYSSPHHTYIDTIQNKYVCLGTWVCSIMNFMILINIHGQGAFMYLQNFLYYHFNCIVCLLRELCALHLLPGLQWLPWLHW